MSGSIKWPAEKIVKKAVSKLVKYEKNSRTHTKAQIKQIEASIKEWGWTMPILIDEKDTVLAGHARLQAAFNLKIEEVPCIIASGWSEGQKKAYVIADNKLSENAGWDTELLASEFSELKALDYDIGLTGFSLEEIGEIGGVPFEGKTDEDDVPETPQVTEVKPGQVWQLGRHRLMCGDSTDRAAVEKLMEGNKADLLLTDPPYNVAYEGKTKDALKIKNDQMSDENFRDFLGTCFRNADAALRQGAAFYIWHADSEGYNFRGAAFDAGWQVRQCLIWLKNSMVLGRQDYQWKHEPCLYGWKGGASHFWGSDRKQTTVLEFDRPSRSAEHPTMKPVALIEYQMLNSTKEGEAVLDLFAGSGSMVIAAEKNNRRAFAMELDPVYCDVIIRRWTEFTGKKAELVDG